MDSDSRAGVTGMNGTYAVEPPVATEISHTTVDAVSSERSPEVRWSWKEEKRNKLVRRFRFQEIFSWKKKKGFMEEEEGLLVSEVDVVVVSFKIEEKGLLVSEVLCGGMDGEERNHVIENELGQKRKRVSNSETEKKEDGVRHLCSDGAGLVLCDRRGCPQAYHPACVDRDGELFRSKGSDSDSPEKKRKTKSPSKSGSAEKILSPAKPSSSGGPDHMDVDPMRSGKDTTSGSSAASGSSDQRGSSAASGSSDQQWSVASAKSGRRINDGGQEQISATLPSNFVANARQSRDMRFVTEATPVNMYHDFENLKITIGDEFFVDNVQKALRTFNTSYYLNQVILCGRSDGMSQNRAARMEMWGRQKAGGNCRVTYVEATRRSLICDNCGNDFSTGLEPPSPLIRMKEIADRILIERFLSYSVENRDAVILVVSEDKDFSYAMQDLLDEGYTVLSACKKVTNLVGKPWVCSAAWLWSTMEQCGPCFRG